MTFGEYEEIIDYNLEGKTKLTEENIKKIFHGNKKLIEIRNYHTMDDLAPILVAMKMKMVILFNMKMKTATLLCVICADDALGTQEIVVVYTS